MLILSPRFGAIIAQSVICVNVADVVIRLGTDEEVARAEWLLIRRWEAMLWRTQIAGLRRRAGLIFPDKRCRMLGRPGFGAVVDIDQVTGHGWSAV